MILSGKITVFKFVDKPYKDKHYYSAVINNDKENSFSPTYTWDVSPDVWTKIAASIKQFTGNPVNVTVEPSEFQGKLRLTIVNLTV